ncbi:hypothetical protein ACQR1Y_11570 [Bradyrhizobium sp. HKCCYLRH3099]|uniref:hypothetical protein n=1 Tax=unclassified Bradyrhizobium TaxID=2631580 RepID=UPI003EBEBB11
MTDITSDRVALPHTVALPSLKAAVGLILCLTGGLVAVGQLAEPNRCEAPVGRWAVQLKLDGYYSNCQCMEHSLDLSDACNSMYLQPV